MAVRRIVTDDITKEDIRKWCQQVNTTMIGRGFEVSKKEDRDRFVNWFYNILTEIKESK